MNRKRNILNKKLVLDYQAGNDKVLPVLVARWHKRFCSKAYWVVKDTDAAKDIAQDSWSTIIAKIGNLKDANSFGSWALRIVYTKSLDWVKHNNVEREKLQEYHRAQLNQELSSTDNEQVKIALLKVIRTLPEHQQMVIRLFYVENYKLKEIGEILNISIGTAKSRLFHAREKLKQILKNKNYENEY